MNKLNIGFAVTGSFCTFKQILPYMKQIVDYGHNIVPIFSYAVMENDTRFFKAEDFKREVVNICSKEPISTIVGAEPIGPKKMLDILVIAPCTGNTLAKVNYGITDTPVAMAAKAQLRNNRPIVIAISTNDGLSTNAKNIGEMLNKKNVYFVPYSQDDYVKKHTSTVADFSLIYDTIIAAMEHRQIQPIIKGE